MDAFDTLRVNFGINDRAFGWKLQPGEAFSTPEAVLVYSENGLGDMSRAYQKRKTFLRLSATTLRLRAPTPLPICM